MADPSPRASKGTASLAIWGCQRVAASHAPKQKKADRCARRNIVPITVIRAFDASGFALNRGNNLSKQFERARGEGLHILTPPRVPGAQRDCPLGRTGDCNACVS